jgi:hypothetical protein
MVPVTRCSGTIERGAEGSTEEGDMSDETQMTREAALALLAVFDRGGVPDPYAMRDALRANLAREAAARDAALDAAAAQAEEIAQQWQAASEVAHDDMRLRERYSMHVGVVRSVAKRIRALKSGAAR